MSTEPKSTQFSTDSDLNELVPLSIPCLQGNEWKYVKECLDSGWVSSVGAFVDAFESSLAEYVGAAHAVATVNGTAALHTALLVAGVQPNDEVVVSTLTFIAPANAIRYVGAWPVFIDAEPTYMQMDVDKVAAFLSEECRFVDGVLRNQASGRRVAAIIPVHILGHPVDMGPLLELAERYSLMVIEDASESLGAEYKGRRVGSFGHLGCFSFNGNKLLTTGGGGMITTNNRNFARSARYLTTQAKDDVTEYVHNGIGFNYRMTNVLAAVGCAQLERVAEHISAKRAIAAHYNERLSTVTGVTLMCESTLAFSVFWMYTIRLQGSAWGPDSRTLLGRLKAQNIECRPLWQPLHLSPAHRGAQAYHCEVADDLYRISLSLPCSVGLTEAQQNRVIQAICAVAGELQSVR